MWKRARDTSIREVAELVRDIVCPGARLVFDASKPDGTPRRRLDVSLHEMASVDTQNRPLIDTAKPAIN